MWIAFRSAFWKAEAQTWEHGRKFLGTFTDFSVDGNGQRRTGQLTGNALVSGGDLVDWPAAGGGVELFREGTRLAMVQVRGGHQEVTAGSGSIVFWSRFDGVRDVLIEDTDDAEVIGLGTCYSLLGDSCGWPLEHPMPEFQVSKCELPD